jgi:CO/xanthine dehydrogenase FAD-binding subunit
MLEGKALSTGNIAAAAAAVAADIDPISDHRASAAYRKAMAVVLTRRSLERAVGRLARKSHA